MRFSSAGLRGKEGQEWPHSLLSPGPQLASDKRKIVRPPKRWVRGGEMEPMRENWTKWGDSK